MRVATDWKDLPEITAPVVAARVERRRARGELERENADLRAEIARLRGAIEDGADTIVRLNEELRVATGQVAIRQAMLDGNEFLSQRVAEARAAIRSTEAL